MDFFFDFETRSREDLRSCGAIRYATSETTEVTLLTWAIGHGPIKVWKVGEQIPDELIDIAIHPEKYAFIAHNIEFDYLIWSKVFFKNIIKTVRPPLNLLECTMALGQRYCAGRGLDQVASVLHLPVKKHPEGRRIMLKQCKPSSNNQFPTLTKMEWDIFIKYGILDTDILRQAYYRLPKLNKRERWAFEWTTRRNLKGIKLDMPLLRGMEQVLKIALPKLSKEFKEITGGAFEVSQNAKFLAWIRQYIPKMPDMQSDTIRDAIDACKKRGIDPKVIRALEIKALAGSTSIKKVKTALDRQYGGRTYQNLVYNGTHTMRWAGSGLQVQNFPRSEDIGDIEKAVQIVSEAPELVDSMYPCAIGLIKSLLRRIFISDEGTSFYCGDYSKIEPTVLFWLVGIGEIPGKWYEDMASTIYSVPIDQIGKESEERQVGKAAALGCGYGLGYVKFKSQVKKQANVLLSDEVSDRAVKAYRKKYHQIVKFWYDLERAFLDAIQGSTTVLCDGKIIVSPMNPNKGVMITLPSKTNLYYHDAALSEGGLVFAQAKQGKVMDKGVYGGLLTEHVTSATARDLMVFGMHSVEHNGFEILNCVHDEIWAQGLPGRASDFGEAMITKPAWAKGIVLTAEPTESSRYMK